MKLHALLYPLPGVFALAACSSMTANLQPTSAHKGSVTPLRYAVSDLGPAGSTFAQATWLNNSESLPASTSARMAPLTPSFG